MKILFTALFSVLLLQKSDGLVNSVWTLKVANGCIDKLNLKSDGKALEYDCEIDYTFNATYKLIKDTLIIVQKDDSHSEDGGKATYYKMKYLVRNNTLFPFDNSQLIHGKWKNVKAKFDKNFIYKRIK